MLYDQSHDVLHDVQKRLIRIESKLSQLMLYLGMAAPVIDGGSTKRLFGADIGRAVVRIESKLHSLMLHEGLDPFTRVQGRHETDDATVNC